MLPTSPGGTSPTRVATGGRSARVIQKQSAPQQQQYEWQGDRNVSEVPFCSYIEAHGDRLTNLDISRCMKLSKTSFMAVAKHCLGLRILDVSKCFNLTDVSMTALAKSSPQLTSLNISGGHNLTDSSLIAIAENCPYLTRLDVSACWKLTDTSLKAVAKRCTSLTSLNTRNCSNLVDPSIAAIAESCPSLTFLDVGGCIKLTDVALVALARHCVALKSLIVESCENLTNKSVMAVAANCASLVSLNITNCSNLTNPSLVAIAERSVDITSLEAGLCSKLTDVSLEVLATQCSGLTSLNIQGWKEVTDKSLISLAEKCPSLTHLDIDWCEKVTDKAVVALAGHCMRLTSLRACLCSRLTDASFLAVVTNCANIGILEGGNGIDIYKAIVDGSITCFQPINPANVTDQSILAVLQCAPMLTNLNVANCIQLSDESLIAIAKYCARLTRLDTSGCRKLTDASMSVVSEHCQSLTSLNVCDCFKLKDPSLLAVAERCPNLTSLDTSHCFNFSIDEKAFINIAQGILTSFTPKAPKLLLDNTLSRITKRCSKITSLGLRNCSQLTDSALLAIAEYCPGLTSLDTTSCLQFSIDADTTIRMAQGTLSSLKPKSPELLRDETLVGIAKLCPNITNLNIAYCSNIRNSTLEVFAEYCPALVSLDVTKCPKLTDDTLAVVVRHCPALTSLNVTHCSKLTDEACITVVEHCVGFQSLNVFGCHLLSVPEVIKKEGSAAVARFYQDLEERSLKSKNVKVIAMGHSMAGTTSIVKALALNDPFISSSASNSASSATPSFHSTSVSVSDENRNSSVNIQDIWDGALSVYDFGGQPEYSLWKRLFLKRNPLVLIFSEFCPSAEVMSQRIIQQLQHFIHTTSAAHVLVVVSKTDLASTPEELAKRIATLKDMIESWVTSIKDIEYRDKNNLACNFPNILPSGFLAVSAKTGEGIEKLASVIGETLLMKEDQTGIRLFPFFKARVPIVFEHIRAFLRAIIYGEDEAAALASTPEKTGALTWKGKTQIVTCFEYTEVLHTKLEVALTAAPEDINSLFQEEGVAETLQSALSVFEGEGFIINAAQIGIVHLVPTWLVTVVEGLGNHRFCLGAKQQQKYINNIAEAWEKKKVKKKRPESVRMLQEYVTMGLLSEELVRAFFMPVMRKFNTSCERLVTVFEAEDLIAKIQVEGRKERLYIAPFLLRDSASVSFEEECKLTGTTKACELTGTFACGFVPSGYSRRLITAMQKIGGHHSHFGLGCIIMHQDGPLMLVYFDTKQNQVNMRAQQKIPDNQSEDIAILSLVEIVHQMRKIAEDVTRHWDNLQLNFEEDIQVNGSFQHEKFATPRQRYIDGDSMNQKLRLVLGLLDNGDEDDEGNKKEANEKPGAVQPLLSPEDVDAISNYMDSNGDGEITLDELMRSMRRAKRMNDKVLKQGRKMLKRLLKLLEKRNMTLEEWFYHMDGQTCVKSHSDGRVTIRELQKGLKLMSDEEPIDSDLRFNPRDVEKIVRFMDLNADGDVSLEECQGAVEKLERSELESLCIDIFQRIETHMKAQKMEFRTFFESLDHSGDGNLSTPELRKGLMSITEARGSEKKKA